MTKWFIEAPNSIYFDIHWESISGKKRLSSRSPLKRDLAVEVRFYCLEKNRDTPSFVVELISILIFNINYQVPTKSKIQDFMVYETAQVYIG